MWKETHKDEEREESKLEAHIKMNSGNCQEWKKNKNQERQKYQDFNKEFQKKIEETKSSIMTSVTLMKMETDMKQIFLKTKKVFQNISKYSLGVEIYKS